MSEDEHIAMKRREFALDKAIASYRPEDPAPDIVARAEEFDAFLRGDKKDQ